MDLLELFGFAFELIEFVLELVVRCFESRKRDS
jgi:hypothetical protein